MPRSIVLLAIVVLSFPGLGYAGDIHKGPSALRSQAIHPIILKPIGQVRLKGKRAVLEILPEYAPALDGLAAFSHVWVLYWFHEHDRPEERAILKVHPRRDPANPLTGVFATRAPVRPNLLGLTACRLLKVKGNTLEVADLDAQEGSPVLDLKPYIPKGDAIPGAAIPEWVKRLERSEKETSAR